MSMEVIQGINSHFAVSGQGQGMVLLHGWGQNMEMMQFIADAFNPYFKVVNLDFPGFGESDNPPRGYGVEDYCDWLHELLVYLNIDHPILIGHSFGCRVAALYASKYPVYKMVLTGAACIKQPLSAQAKIKTKSYKLAKKVMPSLAKKMQNKVGSEDYKNASGVMRETFVKVVNSDLTDILPSITTETLLVWGDQDEATPLWIGKKMEQLMPNAGLAIFEGQGHYAYFYEPQRFINVLAIFFKEFMS